MELQTDRNRAPLFDTGALPLSLIPSGGRQDVVIEQDLKDLGAHTLVRAERKITFGDRFEFCSYLFCTLLRVEGRVRLGREL